MIQISQIFTYVSALWPRRTILSRAHARYTIFAISDNPMAREISYGWKKNGIRSR